MQLKPYEIFSRLMWQNFLDQDNKIANKGYSFWKERDSFDVILLTSSKYKKA
jgi:hypothetical protein